jgi:hypothetical protein
MLNVASYTFRVKNLVLGSLFYAILVPSLFCTIAAGEPDYTKTPVFFVHGHGMTAECWNPMISYLVKSGYPKEYLKTIQLYPNNGPNIEAAEKQIAPAIEVFINKINAFRNTQHVTRQLVTKINLISHSMGALSARWYASKVGPHRVRIWISLAGANHGTDKACFSNNPGSKDMCPAFAKSPDESLVQFVLNGLPHVADVDETPYGVGRDSPGVNSIRPDESKRIIYFSIRTFPDKLIIPEESAVIDGAGGVNLKVPNRLPAKETSEGNILMTNRVGHDEMLSDKNTMKLVETILSDGNIF